MSSVCTAVSEFGWDLFKEISKDGAQKNIFLSPFSISAALAMVAYGARGNTEAQIEKTTTDSQCDRPGGIHSQFRALLSQLNKPSSEYELSIANRLYGSMSFPFVQKFLHCIKELYHAELESVDFKNKIEQTREQINAWVANKTHDKIKDLFPRGSLDHSTVLVLVNAIYFKGQWSSRFKKENTKEAPFRVNQNVSKNVPMMFQSGRFKYAAIQEPPLQLLELPYVGKNLSMIILLPRDSTGHEKLASFLTSKNIGEWLSSMYFQEVNVYLPKFKLEEKYYLKSTLASMGMTAPFEQRADLSGISEKQGLVVSRVIHQSFVEVNEEGTEAAAATGVGVKATSAQIPVVVKADVPFIFIIFHNVFKCPLFIGKYTSP
ncbi:serpin B4-like [Hemicordylus capensis]|uniref:serpin B4-like n=1 Tax=Hemicordylus capensis TaxID=884348 RepID=UPI002302C39D|nr:serpin B4-like [Hemicordylus capensis]